MGALLPGAPDIKCHRNYEGGVPIGSGVGVWLCAPGGPTLPLPQFLGRS